MSNERPSPKVIAENTIALINFTPWDHGYCHYEVSFMVDWEATGAPHGWVYDHWTKFIEFKTQAGQHEDYTSPRVHYGMDYRTRQTVGRNEMEILLPIIRKAEKTNSALYDIEGNLDWVGNVGRNIRALGVTQARLGERIAQLLGMRTPTDKQPVGHAIENIKRHWRQYTGLEKAM